MTTFTNPILPGDRPDPAVIKVGDEYWLTYSSFEAAPGLPLYRSTDLVNWTYETSALPNPVGNTFAVDIAEHDGHFFIYIPFIPTPLTRGVDPNKIYEYFAWGLRVLSAPMGSVDDYPSTWVYRNEDEFVQQLTEALGTPMAKDELQSLADFAAQSTWGHRADTMLEIIRGGH